MAHLHLKARRCEANLIVAAVAAHVLMRPRNALALVDSEATGFGGFGGFVVYGSLNNGVAVGLQNPKNLAHTLRVVWHQFKHVVAQHHVKTRVGKSNIRYRHHVVGQYANGINVGCHQIGGLVPNTRILPNDIVEAFFGGKVQYVNVPVKKLGFVFEVQINQAVPLQRVASVAQGVGSVEGQKLAVRTAAYWAFNGVAEAVKRRPSRRLHRSQLFAPRWTYYFFENRFHGYIRRKNRYKATPKKRSTPKQSLTLVDRSGAQAQKHTVAVGEYRPNFGHNRERDFFGRECANVQTRGGKNARYVGF